MLLFEDKCSFILTDNGENGNRDFAIGPVWVCPYSRVQGMSYGRSTIGKKVSCSTLTTRKLTGSLSRLRAGS